MQPLNDEHHPHSTAYPVKKIVSGAQSGVDRAALDVALKLGIPCGGWCPRGRRSEDGPIPLRYPVQETPTAEYAERTEWNVRDSDATLVLCDGPPTGGTAVTIGLAQKWDRPCLTVDLAENPRVEPVQQWLKAHHIHTLNVAGPRLSTSPRSYALASLFMESLLTSG